MIYYVFFETEDDYGKYRRTFGFRTAAARQQWIRKEMRLSYATEDFSALEEWEAEQTEWPHVRILD